MSAALMNIESPPAQRRPNWFTAEDRSRVSIFIPNDGHPRGPRLPAQEWLAQSPRAALNDLYRRRTSVFNDDT